MNRPTRRQVPAATATGLAASAAPTTPKAFPKGFLFGVAPAAHQVEDNSTNSDSWVVEHRQTHDYAEGSTTPATTIITTLTTSSWSPTLASTRTASPSNGALNGNAVDDP